jgi:hypothetical protein
MPDSLYLLDAVTLDVLASREVSPDDIADWHFWPGEELQMTLQTCRYPPEPGLSCFTALPYVACSGDMQYDVVSALFDTTLAVTDTLGVEVNSYAGSVTTWTRPVTSANGMPVLLWTFFHGYFGSTMVHTAGMHQEDPAPVTGSYSPMLHENFYNPGTGSYSPGEVRALGSCAAHSVGLWTTMDEAELRYSTFDGVDPGAAETAAWPFGYLLAQPCAMSCNPVDPGLLLVWYSSGSVMCRHYQGEWNDYSHVVMTGVGSFGDDNIAVCSVSDGYWAAWLEYGSDRPVVVFIPRDSVTGISSPDTAAPGNGAAVWPNPCGGMLSISVNSSGSPCTVEIYDMNGRLAGTAVPDGQGTCHWDTRGQPVGTLLVRVTGPGVYRCFKVLVLK